MSNSLDSDPDQSVVEPDLGPNCFQSLSAKTIIVTSSQGINEMVIHWRSTHYVGYVRA